MSHKKELPWSQWVGLQGVCLRVSILKSGAEKLSVGVQGAGGWGMRVRTLNPKQNTEPQTFELGSMALPEKL